MYPLLTRSLDRLIIRLAAWTMPSAAGQEPHAEETAALLEHHDFFCDFVKSPENFVFTRRKAFQFPSQISSPWENNNLVHGKLFCCAENWQKYPTVILLHGWNDELGYRFRFPYLAGLFRRAGINTAMIELPLHLQRRPTSPGAITDFISADLRQMVEATRQSLADTRALVKWVRSQGSAPIGLWGVSLGAWLAGLTISHEPEIDVAVLTTPVAKLESVINCLAFCAPIRRSYKKANLSLKKLELVSDRPRMDPANILIHEAEDDLFVARDTIEQLWRAWEKPEIWRLRHGHISILMSIPVMKRTVNWIAEKFLHAGKAAR